MTGTAELCSNHLRASKAYYDEVSIRSGANGAHFDGSRNAWIVTNYDLCLRLLKEPKLGKSRLSFADFNLQPEAKEYVESAQSIIDRQMVFSDCLEAKASHSAWARRLTRSSSNFPHAIIAREFLGRIRAGRSDLYCDVIRPYVSACICQELGISSEERVRLYPLVMGFAALLDGKIQDTRGVWECVIATVLLDRFVKQNIDRLGRASGRTDEDLDRWSADFILTLVAGHESTAYLLGVAVLFAEWMGNSLLEDTKARRCLILEALRVDPPVQMIGRTAVDEVQLFPGCVVDRGSRILLHIGAAGRDLDHFACPDVFDLQRRVGAGLSFGAHDGRCVGRSFALAEADAFLREYGKWRLNRRLTFSQIRYNHGTAGRSFEEIPVQIES